MAISKHCGKWQAKIRRKGYPQQIRTFQYKSEAEAWERESLAEMDRGDFVSRTEAEATTLGDLLQRYLDECVPKLRDAAREANRVKALMRNRQKTLAIGGASGYNPSPAAGRKCRFLRAGRGSSVGRAGD